MYLAQLKRTTIYSEAVFDLETGELLHREPFCTWFGPLDSLEGEAVADPPPTDGDGGGDSNDAPFLEVNERTRYMNAEEAKQGFLEAQQHITDLTPWQQIAMEYGLSDPQDVAALLDELAELRARANAGDTSRNAPAEPTRTAAAPTANLDPNSTEGKQAAALKWLQENGVQAGYVNKDQLSEISQRLEFLTEEAQRVDNERFQQRMEYGRNVLNSELKSAGFYPSDPKDTAGIKAAGELSAILEDALTTWVNADDRRVKAFHAGGESLTNLIKQGLQRILPTFNVLKNSSSATNAARRPAVRTNAAVATTHAAAKPNVRTTAVLKAEDGITPDVHERAWEVAKRIFGEQA